MNVHCLCAKSRPAGWELDYWSQLVSFSMQWWASLLISVSYCISNGGCLSVEGNRFSGAAKVVRKEKWKRREPEKENIIPELKPGPPGSMFHIYGHFLVCFWCKGTAEGGLSCPDFQCGRMNKRERIKLLPIMIWGEHVNFYITYVIFAIRYPLSATDSADQPTYDLPSPKRFFAQTWPHLKGSAGEIIKHKFTRNKSTCKY
jgi:hypothetical protein